jgi:hypothetical protein
MIKGEACAEHGLSQKVFTDVDRCIFSIVADPQQLCRVDMLLVL